ncbi:RNA_pol_Rpb2_6 domain-containing protein [Trichonephila clavata]|uniref:RNA_pol_Rpb2_6 domain-containing protein n=1 Tax=Trichonephila clavata TaxID=2740835 RepID=A0A8X6LSK0_TRICU|nr:RNA_pol_Rpb2_6 domain-containing protein [Trichonephila clavata]
MTMMPHESHQEIGSNGAVFVEKTIGCYREVNMQTYRLNPFLSYLIVRQMSNKVKHGSVPSFHDSYLGFLCILGCFETKNVGRTTMMVRNTIVSTVDVLDPVFHDAQHDASWTWLQLEPDSHIHPHYFVVVNEACIPVTEACFQRIQLYALKQQFRHVECFAEFNFMYIRY